MDLVLELGQPQQQLRQGVQDSMIKCMAVGSPMLILITYESPQAC